MICTVSTIKESPERVRQFVDDNLSAGVDHMFEFVDAPNGPVVRYLAEHPHCTVVRTDDRYWDGDRPPNLNSRQRINANLVRTLLAPLSWCDWLFHIDADECLDIDREQLETLADDVHAVRLSPWESVSGPHAYSGSFKRLLDRDELRLLRLLGVLRKPTNRALFHGHVQGKVGIRPSLDLALSIHWATIGGGERILGTHDHSWYVLHRESVSEDDFMTKWSGMLDQPGNGTHRGFRAVVRSAVSALVTNEKLDDQERSLLLHQVYTEAVADPVGALERLGYLERPDPGRHRHTPRPPSGRQLRETEALLDVLLAAPKRSFLPTAGLEAQRRELRAAARSLTDEHGDLADRVEATVAREPSPVTPDAPRTP
ncbi:glycosyltransferase family 2 protein [Isoptericola aurantiacus]|uniref:glycosyltransferase family 2 protein n=1 Tax=Isoptericola aurantiacus TaxID=3377839 RepID=UPI00383B7973